MPFWMLNVLLAFRRNRVEKRMVEISSKRPIDVVIFSAISTFSLSYSGGHDNSKRPNTLTA